MEGLTIRLGTAEDADVLARHRCQMFSEMGVLSAKGYPDLEAASIQYFRESLPDGAYLAWLVCDDDEVVAGGGMQVNTIPPRPGPDGNLLGSGPQGLIVNMYVEKPWRRKGVASWLLREMIDFARQTGIPSLTLHASNEGRPLYERHGFTPTSEMRLYI